MEKRVLTVLRGGGEYGPEHVQAIQRQVAKWAPAGTQLLCLTDTDVPGVDCLPLYHDWPGWWSKLELFRPDTPDGFLYTDLDNVLFGPIDFAFESDEFTADIGFSFFRFPPGAPRAKAYVTFVTDAEKHMAEWAITRTDGKFGDAAFLRHHCGLTPAKWDPKKVINIVEMAPPCPWRTAPPGRPKDLRVMLCGGVRRRPWLSSSLTVREAYWCR